MCVCVCVVLFHPFAVWHPGSKLNKSTQVTWLDVNSQGDQQLPLSQKLDQVSEMAKAAVKCLERIKDVLQGNSIFGGFFLFFSFFFFLNTCLLNSEKNRIYKTR